MKVTRRATSKANISCLKDRLSQLDYSTILDTTKNLDVKTQYFIETLTTEINHHLPHKTQLIKFEHLRKDPWITSALVKSMNKSKNSTKKQLKGDDKDSISYKNYNDVLKKVKRHAKRQFYIDKCIKYKSNTRQLWSTINRLVKTHHDKSNVISHLRSNRTEITDPQRISNTFCSYFSNVGKSFASRIPNLNKSIDNYLTKIRKK